MADSAESQIDRSGQTSDEVTLEGGTYEIIRNRLTGHAKELRSRLDKLNDARKDVFGSIETTLLRSERISTENNCVPRDMVALGNTLLFGYNVFIGLRSETRLEDVFAVYEWADDQFRSRPLDMLNNDAFCEEFKNLYKYYRKAVFAKFAVIGPHLFMVFRAGKGVADVRTFKWLIRDGQLEYIDSRSDHEYQFPPQHGFAWKRVTHDMHRDGLNPHISIEDRLFVETVGGDLTVKIEDNTATGEGIYSEPVENPDQTLDDAEIYYAIVGNSVLIKVRPYQEEDFRYLIYNDKVQRVTRVDSIRDSCVLLPEDHGLIFPKGYYLQTGEHKQFDIETDNLLYEKRLASPNGEDYLYVFYNRDAGAYLLLSYNLIAQQVNTPVLCHGYSLFDDGTLLYFRDDGEAQRHHAVQVWQTPYCAADHSFAVQQDSRLFNIGNKDIVRCMTECTELGVLIAMEDTYANLYVDISKGARDILDSYFWLTDEATFRLDEPLGEILQAATSAIEEYDKVSRTKQNTAKEIALVAGRVAELVKAVDYDAMTDINQYVRLLADFRSIRGDVIGLKELRYADLPKVENLDAQVAGHTEELSARCVEFLLQPEALQPYHDRIAGQDERIEGLVKATEAKELSDEVSQTGRELEMLTEIVSNLKIEDATQTTAIIESISLNYQQLNQVKSGLKNRLRELGRLEGQAEFTSQMKLLDQATTSYLDVCETPAKCDEYLSRVMGQMETLDAKFADFDEFIVLLSEKREELCNAFESRKVQLVEQRNRRATALMTAAERILKGVRNRVEAMSDISEINGYLASDLMIERLREHLARLDELGDTVKAEDVRSQLKSIQQDAVRQLKDRQSLYEDGENIIRFGTHKFAVNHQPLELTVVMREGRPSFHLTGTGFFDPIRDEQFLETIDAWPMEVVSETPDVYRAEYLPKQMLDEYSQLPASALEELAALDTNQLLSRVQEFMAPRYAEGYIKGVHDQDAAKILEALLNLKVRIGLLRYPSQSRALAILISRWTGCDGDSAFFRRLESEVAGLGRMQGLFDYHGEEQSYIQAAQEKIDDFIARTQLFPAHAGATAAEYLFHELATEGPVVLSPDAADLQGRFIGYLKTNKYATEFEQSLALLADEPLQRFQLIRKWLRAYVADRQDRAGRYVDEVAVMLLEPEEPREKISAEIEATVTGLVGSHPRIINGEYTLDYTDFMARLAHHQTQVAPLFETCQRRKKELTDAFSKEMRLEEFQPHVLTTFVRNKLIDRVYLQLVGDNLAKQIGSSGDTRRTDRQGLLLMISPPGYGKTTLMAYIANRIGLIFMKINGPAIGHRVTSLDPAEAPNAAAREELVKLNLAFEMGDNVMIYLDDIQHVNPELLQKFISLCDATRRVEGVYKGRPRVYDLRGKRVAVVMACNPYTESGEKFRIPDMLSNRADVYNIGDIVGDNYDVFIDSYVENCLTSNPVLASLANRSQDDVYSVMKLAEGQPAETVEFEGNYTPDELNEYVSTMKKLFVVREVVLKVNQEYIRSAAQADEYRTEPRFLLQGSYRNMNRIAERVLPVMNDEELWTLIYSGYEQDAQTLTTGAESNLLKFKELTGRLSEEEEERWEAIKKTYQRNKLLGSGEDQISQVIGQLNSFGVNLESIRDTIAEAAGSGKASRKKDARQAAIEQIGQKLDGIAEVMGQAADRFADSDKGNPQIQAAADAILDRLNEVIEVVRKDSQLQHETAKRNEALTINDNAQTMLAVLEEQFKTLEMWLQPITKSKDGRKEYVGDLITRFEQMVVGYKHLIEILHERNEQ